MIGYYEIPVPPGTYTVQVENIDSEFVGGSSVGPLGLPFMVYANKYWHAYESAYDDPSKRDPITVAAGQTVSKINIILNGTPSRFDQFEEGALHGPWEVLRQFWASMRCRTHTVKRARLGCRIILPFTLLLAACGGAGGSAEPSPAPPPPVSTLAIATDSAMRAVIGVPLSVTLQAVGGTGALTWSVTAGQLPPGLGLGSSTGLISGTPTSGWGSPFVIQVADAKTTVAKQFYFNLYTKLGLNPVTPPSAHLNAPYSLQLFAQLAGSGIASWVISAGQLPTGLQLSGGAFNTGVASVSGTPTQSGSFSFTVQIQDYTMPQTASEDMTIVVDTHLAIAKWNLQGGGQNQPYADAFTAVNGVPPYTWSATGLPSALNLNASTGQSRGRLRKLRQF